MNIGAIRKAKHVKRATWAVAAKTHSNFSVSFSNERSCGFLGFPMTFPTNDKREEYVGYTEHCLKLAKQTPDAESRLILRKMATEWLRLAERAS
jgi:hypothetical protein